MKRIRVLYFISTLERSGPTNVVYNVVKHLDKTRFDPLVVTLSPEPANSRKSEFESIGIEVHSFQKSRLFWLVSGGAELKSFISKLRPDIIHSHSFRADVSSAKHLDKYCRVSTIHADMTANYRNSYNKLFADWLVFRQVNAISRLERAVACSAAVQSVYRGNIPALYCVPNGVDHEVLPLNDLNERKSLRERLSLPPDKMVITSVGSICQRKDPRTVIQGFLDSGVRRAATLVFVGDGPLRLELAKEYASEDIVWIGFTDRAVDYLRASDFFVSASHSEGLPNTVLESLSVGVPVCLSDIPPHREILKLHSLAGQLFAAGDASQLSSAIDKVAAEDYFAMRCSARKIIDDEYNAPLMAERYADIYSKMLPG